MNLGISQSVGLFGYAEDSVVRLNQLLSDGCFLIGETRVILSRCWGLFPLPSVRF